MSEQLHQVEELAVDVTADLWKNKGVRNGTRTSIEVWVGGGL
jgi:hypothetical protein